MKLKTPDITKAQMIALATGIVGVFASMGAPLSAANEARLFNTAVAIPTVLMIADAVIRFGRAQMAGKKFEAQAGYSNEELGLPED